MILSADTNLFLYAANPDSPQHAAAREFFAGEVPRERFLLCGLVLVEVYMQLRNPAIFRKPKSARDSAAFCDLLRSNPSWEFGDYESHVGLGLWKWAAHTTTGFRDIVDARLALTLRHHGVTHFATANVTHFAEFGFESMESPPRFHRLGDLQDQRVPDAAAQTHPNLGVN